MCRSIFHLEMIRVQRSEYLQFCEVINELVFIGVFFCSNLSSFDELISLKRMINFDQFNHFGQEGKDIKGLEAKGGLSSIFTFFNLPAGAELVLEAEEFLPLAGAEGGSFIVIPFKVSALNVDFDFKTDLIVFGPETGSTSSNFFSERRGVLQTENHQLNHNQLLKSRVESSVLEDLGILLLVIDISELSAEDFKNTGSLDPKLENLSVYMLHVFGTHGVVPVWAQKGMDEDLVAKGD
ncbi:hypothetical protein Tco_0857599 [Tanacetum coccineum]|uniref:Uncharacterized protein n=1 Tax=Tanacetum coccineum TaxID=301880 RepID=A0ABQ5BA22_9ASTR